MAEEVTGASRRDMIRGGAIGVGALMGAMALTNANEVAAEAAGSNRSYLLSITGISDAKNIKLSSFGFGGDDVNGTPTPERVTLTMGSGAQSPFLLKAFAQQKNTLIAVINGYQPNAAGVEQNSIRITCTGAEIVHYHLGVSSSGAPVDNIQLVFGSIELQWLLQNVFFTWTPVA